MVTEDQIIKWSGNEKAAPVVTQWFNFFCDQYAVNTPPRISAFMAQLIHECDGFKTAREYASGKEYEFRADLGNIIAGDGVRFLGRGYIQVTGRNNYMWMGKEIFGDVNVLINNPEKLEEPQYAMQSAFIYWDSKDLNKYSDLPIDQQITTRHHGIVIPFKFQTLLINGGFNGYDNRVLVYNKICTDFNLPTLT